jgi:hypothetical protein
MLNQWSELDKGPESVLSKKDSQAQEGHGAMGYANEEDQSEGNFFIEG